jgi:hypothetical protein
MAGSRIEAARRRACSEAARADRAAQVAQRHEALSNEEFAALAELHRSVARMHRRMEQVHRTAARMHTSFADRLRAWSEAAEGWPATGPSFINAVADAVGAGGSAVTLFGADHTAALVATSDADARIAQDVEFILGEGPTLEATTRVRPVAAVGGELLERWPQYGREVVRLGVSAVVAVPLRRRDSCLGALAVVDPPRIGLVVDLNHFETVADALTRTVLLEAARGDLDDGLAGASLFEDADDRRVIHQAAGIVSVQNDCEMAAALSLIRARAFAMDEPSSAVAERIVAGNLRLT